MDWGSEGIVDCRRDFGEGLMSVSIQRDLYVL